MTAPRTTPRVATLVGGLLAAVLAVGLAGCGSSDHGSAPARTSSQTSPSPSTSPSASSSASASGGSSASAKIVIKDFAFTGATSVPAGATVSVTNDDAEAHTLTADQGDAFDVTIPPGATKTFTAPGKAGAYAYHCNFHADMKGTLTVS